MAPSPASDASSTRYDRLLAIRRSSNPHNSHQCSHRVNRGRSWCLGGAGLVLAVGQAPEANTWVAVRTLVTPEINPVAKPSDATAEAPQPPENGSAAFHVVYSSELNGAH